MAGVYRPRHPETKPEAERVGKYMLQPVLALERLTFLEPEGKVGYRWGRDGPGQETEVMDYLEFIALPSKGWSAMIRKFYEVDPMLCPKCGGRMNVIAFLMDFSVVDRIIGHLKLTYVAERPPPPQVASQELLMAADPPAEYFS